MISIFTVVEISKVRVRVRTKEECYFIAGTELRDHEGYTLLMYKAHMAYMFQA